MNRKAFISLDTLISIFLLGMIVIITQNTNNLINRGYSIIEDQRQEMEEFDKLVGKISIEDIANYDLFWKKYKYENKIFEIRKIYDDKNFIKLEIKLDGDNDNEKTYEKIICK